MSNPWETSNPWGKGSKEWNRWMAPEAVDGAVMKGANNADLSSLLENAGTTYIDENGVSLFPNDTQLRANLRTIRRADGLLIRKSSKTAEEKVADLVSKSTPLFIPSSEEQTMFARNLLQKSIRIEIELVAYVAYNFGASRISFIEEPNTSANDLHNSDSYYSGKDIENLRGPKSISSPHKNQYVQNSNYKELQIGILHTHPSGGYSILSDKDWASSRASALAIMAIQDGKVLMLGVPNSEGALLMDESHNLRAEPFDFARFSLKHYLRTRYYV